MIIVIRKAAAMRARPCGAFAPGAEGRHNKETVVDNKIVKCIRPPVEKKSIRNARKEICMRVENGNAAGIISGVGAAMSAGLLGQNEDAQSKSIRKQIEEKQQELSELSAKEDMGPEEKMKKRQELIKEISDLNMQLRQHQMEKRMQEKAERQKQSRDVQNAGGQRARNGSKGKGGAQAAGLSAEGMSAMLSADASMKQAMVQGGVSNRMENRAGVLKAEIKLDSARGGSTEGKEAELAEVEAKAVSAASAQAGSLREVNENVREAREAERGNPSERTKTDHSAETDSAEKAGEKQDGVELEIERSRSELYPPVDIRV